MKKYSLLVVDDDPGIRELIVSYFTEDGHRVYSSADAGGALDAVAAYQPDVILLDLVLEEGDGLTLLEQLRSRTSAPVLIISGKEEVTDKVVALELGADDFLTKPFQLREVEARVKSALRRIEHSAAMYQMSSDSLLEQAHDVSGGPVILNFNGWQLNCATYELFDPQGESVGLTSGEFGLLKVFVETPGRVLSRDQLFEITRDGRHDAFDRAIDIQIGRLRRKLQDNPRAPAYIKTVRGIGYKFVGKVA